MLEIISKEIPETFLQTQDINLMRLCEVLFLTLSRTTVGPEAELFNTVLTLRSTGWIPFLPFSVLAFSHPLPQTELEKVDRNTIVSPVLGILLQLCESTIKNNPGSLSTVPVIQYFASHPGVSPQAFEFFLGSDFDFSQCECVISSFSLFFSSGRRRLKNGLLILQILTARHSKSSTLS